MSEEEEENQSWGVSISDKSAGENKEKLAVMNVQKEERKRSRGKRRINGGEGMKDGKGGESDHEIHIWTERERRRKMRNMFSTLHALLPHLPSKVDKSTIVDEAVSYIKTLEQTLENLQKEKVERLQSVSTFGNEPSREAIMADQRSCSCTTTMATSNPSISQYQVGFQTWASSNVVLNICGDEAQFSVCSPKKQCLFTAICFVLQKHELEVLSAHISSRSNRSLYMIQAQANRDSNQFPEAFSVEEKFRQAAGEIMLWLS